jgi:hypothetical protein
VIDKFARAAKAWLGAIVAGVGALELALTDDVLTLREGVHVAGVFFGALVIVYNVTNQLDAPKITYIVADEIKEEPPRAA